jgi:hypothetical protein
MARLGGVEPRSAAEPVVEATFVLREFATGNRRLKRQYGGGKDGRADDADRERERAYGPARGASASAALAADSTRTPRACRVAAQVITVVAAAPASGA